VGDKLLAMEKDGGFYYAHTDHLGTTLRMTKKNKDKVVWLADYRPFGEAEVDEDPDGNGKKVKMNLRFPGQYFDKETELHYNYFRYYHPGIGRYLTPDPIGLDGGINPFAYVENNPINFVDPYGLLCTPSYEMKTCLERIFGESIDAVKVYDHSLKPWPYYITTRKNAIYIRGSCNVFWYSYNTVLEEYHHVLRQFNTGRLTRRKYAIAWLQEGYLNKWEREAKNFANNNDERLRKCVEELQQECQQEIDEILKEVPVS
jgi:RHS repeat-associated protein